MLLDPIDWNAFKHDFREWAEQYVPEYVIPDWTDKLFQERESLTHESRSRRCEVPSSLSVYKFFDARAVRRKRRAVSHKPWNSSRDSHANRSIKSTREESEHDRHSAKSVPKNTQLLYTEPN